MGAINARLAYKNLERSAFQLLVFMALAWQTVTILFFMYNQSVWVLKEHDTLVGGLDSTLWLMYDYSNKFFHLTSSLILYYYLHFHSPYKDVEAECTTGWTCPVIDTSALDDVKARLDSLSEGVETK